MFMEFVRAHQTNVMLVIASIVATVLVFTIHITFRNKKAKRALIAMEISALIMIVMDRAAYIYRGDESTLGFYMVRISNFLVFFSILMELASFIRYVIGILTEADEHAKVPKLLYYTQYLTLFGVALLVISQFTGLYYTFDDTNHYQRSAGFPICYAIPLIIFVILTISIIKLYRYLNARLRVLLLLFPIIIMTGSVVQLFAYGLSINTLLFCVMTVVLLVSSILDLNANIAEAYDREVALLQEQNKNVQELFSQTVEALASSIDAKDKYTHGHSTRVAEYSVRLAQMAGKSEEECEEIYFAGILHDVGKIGIPDAIITKEGKLTDEEFAIIKTHPTVGAQILSRITQRPYLSIGAHYHHERYDGKGYPNHLKGDDIPEIARIIAVADAYDAMTSKRSYRDPIPQQKVREEILKGMDTQFDSKYALLMLEMIDSDIAYELKEKASIEQLDGRSEMTCGEYREDVTTGFKVFEKKTTIKFNATPTDKSEAVSMPTLILFDSLNGRVFQNEADVKITEYYEYAEICMDGRVSAPGVREQQIRELDPKEVLREYQYYVEAVRYEDHMLAKIDNGKKRYEITFALPDSSRYVYLALTGEHCVISDITETCEEEAIGDGYIPRLAPRIVYLDIPDGDLPNVEIFNYKTRQSRPVLLQDKLAMEFTYKSMPTASRIWHCPMLVLFTSEDGSVGGAGYREYASIRFDGESWSNYYKENNRINVIKTDDFMGWESWKAANRQGVHCELSLKQEDNKVLLEMENSGIQIHNTTVIPDAPQDIYVCITGDQCVVAGIKVYS